MDFFCVQKQHCRFDGMYLIFAVCLAFFFPVSPADAAENSFGSVKSKLIQEGFSADHISRVYHPELSPLFKTVSNTLRIQESRLNYDQFLSSPAITQARNFLYRYENVLVEAETQYGVERFVVVAILLVETRLGQYTGNTPTLAVLSTFALMDQPFYRDQIWNLLPTKDRNRLGRPAFDEKLNKRAEWAYKELVALLRWTKGHYEKTISLHGSVMGAIGWPQFLPSSLIRYGVDGNGDGKIDLFEPTDAIFSAANYLRAFGWPQAKSRSEKEDVIYHYNRSRPYVYTILEVAERLSRQAAEDTTAPHRDQTIRFPPA